jgi:hypothetical protein
MAHVVTMPKEAWDMVDNNGSAVLMRNEFGWHVVIDDVKFTVVQRPRRVRKRIFDPTVKEDKPVQPDG